MRWKRSLQRLRATWTRLVRHVVDGRWNVLSGIGWCVLAVTLGALVLAVVAGWVEAMVIAVMGALLLLIGLLSIIWRSWCEVGLHLPSNHTVVGHVAVGELRAHNTNRRRSSSGIVELPVGSARAHFRIPALSSEAQWSQVFTVPTRRRGVLDIGPARSVMSDPLGLASRRRLWTQSERLWVHPRTVRLHFNTVGFQADIEGEATQNLVSSDISFHALRDYVPGDDVRHIHWPTTARTGQLAVRQFQEARRSHHVIILDTDPSAWAGDDFELGVSVAASLAVSTLKAGRQVSVATGETWLATTSPTRLLDDLTEVNPTSASVPMAERVNSALAQRPGASALTLIVGAETPDSAASRWSGLAGPDIGTTLIRISPGFEPRRVTVAGTLLIDCPRLEELPLLARRDAR